MIQAAPQLTIAAALAGAFFVASGRAEAPAAVSTDGSAEFSSGLEAQSDAQKPRDGGIVSKVSAPNLYIEGEPYFVSVTITAEDKFDAEIPAWLLTPAAWLVDSKPLVRREEDAKLSLLAGQSISTVINLAGAIHQRFEGDARDFRISFAEGNGEPTDVIFLGLPERGIKFEELPKEQLEDYHVVLETSAGRIWLELWPEVAPNHVRNFLDLCATGFYDGSPFHRAIPTFMVQAGRAKDGSAAPRKLVNEFSSRAHAAGVLSAARLDGDINSATSEFFIVHQASRHLDGQYTAFGKVIEGMNSVENVVKAVEAHYSLLRKLKNGGVRINPSSVAVAVPRDTPSPAQFIRQALVVKATKSRPRAADGSRDR